MSIDEIAYNCWQKNVPFYCYHLPCEQEIIMGVQKEPEIKVFSGFNKLKGQKGFLLVPFSASKNEQALFIHEDFRIVGETKNELFENWINSISFKTKEFDKPEYELTKTEYQNRISKLIDFLKQETISKVVYSRVISLNQIFMDKFHFFRTLVDDYPDAFVYCFHIPGGITWMGVSPEIFLSVRPGLMQTVALAGTKNISDSYWTYKEYQEQEYVSRFIHEVFDKCFLNNRIEEGPKSVQAGKCVHLRTDFSVRADLSAEELEKLIWMLHPTPAVCGYPKEKAKAEIMAREPHQREYYAGFVGPVSALDQIDLYVNLRCMKIWKERVELFVGGGITKDSDPEKEWQETVLKSKTLLSKIKK